MCPPGKIRPVLAVVQVVAERRSPERDQCVQIVPVRRDLPN
jgi:hypothetical protein